MFCYSKQPNFIIKTKNVFCMWRKCQESRPVVYTVHWTFNKRNIRGVPGGKHKYSKRRIFERNKSIILNDKCKMKNKQSRPRNKSIVINDKCKRKEEK